MSTNPSKYTEITCTACPSTFTRLISAHNAKVAKGIKPFCSHACRATYYSTVDPKGGRAKNQETIDKIVYWDKRGRTSYEIADLLNISRNTVMKYWTGRQHPRT